jgi:hypothetical protein
MRKAHHHIRLTENTKVSDSVEDQGQKDSGSGPASKNLMIFNPKNCFLALGNMIWDVHPGSGSRIRILIYYPSRIPDAEIQKAPDPGSGTLV